MTKKAKDKKQGGGGWPYGLTRPHFVSGAKKTYRIAQALKNDGAARHTSHYRPGQLLSRRVQQARHLAAHRQNERLLERRKLSASALSSKRFQITTIATSHPR